MIESAVTDSGIEMSRICNFMKCPEKEIEEMYQAKSLDTGVLLRWSKLLEYDFFRIYRIPVRFSKPDRYQKK